MKTRILLTTIFCAIVAVVTLKPVVAIEKELGIGSKAPALDIEHWIQDGNGFFQPVTEFADGKVYVVEFWATWCGPCIASMPHIAELQNKYRGRGVQIVSVSDESIDEVKDLLTQQNDQVGKTFAEITSTYSLTTDPDGSVHKSYMEASGQQGIPTAFIVGKTGLVEWIGHPMEMEEPLESVVTDSWDREAFKELLRLQEEFEESMARVSKLASAGKFEDALKFVDEQLAKTKDERMVGEWKSIRSSLSLMVGPPDEEVLAYYRGQLKELKGDAYSVARFGFNMFNVIQQGGQVGPLAAEAAAAIEAELDGAEEELKPLLFNTLALIYEAEGKLPEAIKAQEAAIRTAPDRQKQRLQPALDALKEKAAAQEAAKQ